MNTSCNDILRLFSLSLLTLLLLCCSSLTQAALGEKDIPPRVRVLMMRLSPMLEKQEYAKAVELILRLQAKSPIPDGSAMARSSYHHPEMYFVLGNCYLLQNQYANAIAAYRAALSGAPRHSYGWLNLAKAHYELKHYHEAGDCFAKGYEAADGKNAETLYYSAASLLMGEEYQAAINSFARLQCEHPGDFKLEWKEYYVHALLVADRSSEAIPIITELIECYEGEKRLQWQEILLNQYMQQKDDRRALAYATQLTEESPQVANWWKARTHIELDANHYERALATLVIYGFLAPLDEEEKKLLADLYLQVGIPAKAVPVYADYMQQKTDGEILYRLALAYDQLGEPGKSLQTLKDYANHTESEPDYDLYMLQGEISYRLKKFKEASISFSKAAKCPESRSGQAWLLAGYAALQMEDFSQCREAFKRAAGFEKERKAALKALQQLNQAAMAQVSKVGGKAASM